MSMKVTIEIEDESMTLVDGQSPKARPMWIADGVTFFVRGALLGKRYEQAANLAMNWCEERHIPASWLRRYSTATPRPSKLSDTLSNRMKGF